MSEQDIITDEIDDLFKYCKKLLRKREFKRNQFVNSLFELSDLRAELSKTIEEQEAHKAIYKAYVEVFPDTALVLGRKNQEIIQDIALCYRRARKFLASRKVLLFIFMIIIINIYEKELIESIGSTRATLLVALACRIEFLKN